MKDKESMNKYRIDHQLRSQNNADMLYFFDGGDQSDLACDEVFLKLKKYLFDNANLVDGESLLSPKKIEYHARFGWVLENEKIRAYLGKLSLNGNVKIKIGKSSYVSGGCQINGSNLLTIGSFVSIAHGVEFFTSNIDHPISFPTTFNLHSNARLVSESNDLDLPNFSNKIEQLKERKSSITIGSDVWIGRNALILPGVSIPNGCVVGARSIVTKPLEPYGVYVGSPARLVKYRFRKSVIDELQKIKWYNWSNEKIRENQLFFDTDLNEYQGSLFELIK